MISDRGNGRPNVVIVSSAMTILISIGLAVLLRAHVPFPTSTKDGSIDIGRFIKTDLADHTHDRQESFNKGLPMRVDDFTTLQRVDFKKGYWNFHFSVSYYITRVKEFEEKKHAATIDRLCMDHAFVQSLKDSGPFLYQYLDPSGQTADVVIPKDDCGE